MSSDVIDFCETLDMWQQHFTPDLIQCSVSLKQKHTESQKTHEMPNQN